MLDTFNPFEKKISALEADDLLKLKAVHEGWYVDYKQAPLKPRSYAKAISAMANTYGGWVFIGVKEQSRDHNTAGSFPGVRSDQTDLICQNIRQAVAEHLNPTPFFEIKAVNSPDASSGENVICVHVPASSKAPIIHSDGRIYRRVNDASEPVQENNREAVEHLIRRSDRVERFFEDWFERDPELSKAEDGVSYLRLIAVPDYWGEENLWLEESTEEFAKLLADPADGISFSVDYGNIFSQRGGFVCRHLASEDARQFTVTLKIWRDLRTEFWLPLPSFDVEGYSNYHDQNDILGELVYYLATNGHNNSTVLDLTQAFGAIDGFFTLNRKFQKHLGYSGDTHVKFRLGNVWRRVPVLSLSHDELGWPKYGVPMILQDTVSSAPAGRIGTFQTINLHEKNEEPNLDFLLSIPVFMQLLTAMGLCVGSNSSFSELVNKSVMGSVNRAKKKGFSE